MSLGVSVWGDAVLKLYNRFLNGFISLRVHMRFPPGEGKK